MKRNTRKGFTIVELVVVIAVITILAAVLITEENKIIYPNEDGSRSEQYVICNQVTDTFYNVVEK